MGRGELTDARSLLRMAFGREDADARVSTSNDCSWRPTAALQRATGADQPIVDVCGAQPNVPYASSSGQSESFAGVS